MKSTSCIVVALLFGTLLMHLPLYAQNPQFETREEKAKRGEALFFEGSELFKKKTPDALAAATSKFGEARVIFQQLGDKKREGFCLTWLGAASGYLGDKKSALTYFDQALKIYESLTDKSAVAQIHSSIANLSHEFGDTKAALEHFESAAKIYTELGEQGDVIDTLKVIGKIHLDLGDRAKAISFNERALVVARSAGDRKREADVLSNIGSLHVIAGDHSKAVAAFDEILALARREKNKTLEGEALDLLATAYRLKGDTASTLSVLDRALQLARETGDKRAEVKALNGMAEAKMRSDGLEAAAKFADEALKISVAAGDKQGEGAALLNLGMVHARLSEQAKAVEELKKAIMLLDASRDLEKAALGRMVLGAVQGKLGNKKEALQTSMEALTIAQIGGYSEIEVEVGNNVGALFLEMGESEKALQYLRAALPLAQKLGLKEAQARIQLNIGNALRAAGKNPEAIENLNKAEEGFKAAGDRTTAIKGLMNKGGVYLDLGENEKALAAYMEAMFMVIEGMQGATKEELDADTGLFATLLNNLGRVFHEMGALRRALDHYQQSLPMLRELKDKDRESITLTNIADIQNELGEKQKALESLDQAMALARETGNTGQEATILNSYGGYYSELGVLPKAIEYYGRSLSLLKLTGDPRKEAITLSNLFSVHDTAGHFRTAAFYGKLAVNKFQSLRSSNRAFDRQTQKIYLAKVESVYRLLSRLLIRDGRLAEAQQTLNALKDQQSFDEESVTAPQLKPLQLTPRESEVAAKVDGIWKSADTGDQARKAGDEKFMLALQQMETELSSSPDAKDKVGEISDVSDMRLVLAEIEKQTGRRAVAVYLLAGRDDLTALVLSANDARSASVAVKRSDLDAKAKTFWALLQSDRFDPTVVGKELYDIVFKPIEDKLPSGTGSILWSLDGSLRYVPMAALYDGKQYLVERYNHINFTRADRDRLTHTVAAKWTATGLGTSKEHTVGLLGNVKNFGALPGVSQELGMLVSREKTRGIFEGSVLQDEAFTKAAMLDALKAKRPLVHISTHFSFSPGDEAQSFLLLGDGKPFTLADMKKEKDLFGGVELLTLSACNTAAQQASADGREVDAFFELAQRLGAQSVLATLWPVADNSTPWLMREFYDLKVNRKQNKAEALRNAQLSLLKGSARASRSTVRTNASGIKIVVADGERSSGASTRADEFVIQQKDSKPYLADPKRPFAHPFYWAPFVLIGNWR